VNDNHSVTIPHDPVKAAAILKDTFPEEESGIDAYFTHILNPKKRISGEEIAPDRSVGEVLDSIITNEQLKLVLLGNLGYFHDDPYTLSLAYYTIAQGSYYNGGASFIKGGSQKLSDHLSGFITSHGGEVLMNHLVTGLIFEGEKLTGVSYRKKRDNSGEVLTAFADEIIANASMPQIADMLPPEKGLKLKAAIGEQKPGASLLTIYFGFKGKLSSIGHAHYSTFVFDGSVKSQGDILRNNRDDFDKRSFTFVDYGQIDSELAPKNRSVGALCCIDYLSDWENLSVTNYKAKKEMVTRILISRLEKLIPGFMVLIDYYEVGTSATVKRYTLNPEGAVYGFAQNPDKPSIETSQIIPNLHFASAWGKTGGGFSGAIFSGYLCAYNILRKR
jgi:phytoene dehydrogenase-like protein